METPLHLAADKGYLESIVVLARNGADMEAVTFPGGDTPLWLAIINKDREAAELLIMEGAKVPKASERTQCWNWTRPFIRQVFTQMLETSGRVQLGDVSEKVWEVRSFERFSCLRSC